MFPIAQGLEGHLNNIFNEILFVKTGPEMYSGGKKASDSCFIRKYTAVWKISMLLREKFQLMTELMQ